MDSDLFNHARAAPVDLSADQRLDWLRLIRSRRVGPVTFHRLLAEYGTAAAAVAALPGIAAAAGVKDYATCRVEVAAHEMSVARIAGAKMLCWGEAAYPGAVRLERCATRSLGDWRCQALEPARCRYGGGAQRFFFGAAHGH